MPVRGRAGAREERAGVSGRRRRTRCHAGTSSTDTRTGAGVFRGRPGMSCDRAKARGGGCGHGCSGSTSRRARSGGCENASAAPYRPPRGRAEDPDEPDRRTIGGPHRSPPVPPARWAPDRAWERAGTVDLGDGDKGRDRRRGNGSGTSPGRGRGGRDERGRRRGHGCGRLSPRPSAAVAAPGRPSGRRVPAHRGVGAPAAGPSCPGPPAHRAARRSRVRPRRHRDDATDTRPKGFRAPAAAGARWPVQRAAVASRPSAL